MQNMGCRGFGPTHDRVHGNWAALLRQKSTSTDKRASFVRDPGSLNADVGPVSAALKQGGDDGPGLRQSVS